MPPIHTKTAVALTPSSDRAMLVASLDGAAFTVPLSLGCAALIYGNIDASLLGAGVLATLLGLVWLHLTTAADNRPMLFSARFFEAATLGALLAELWSQLRTLGLEDTPGVRLACMIALIMCSAVIVGILYLVRADRFTRFLPAPVFAGFANAISIIVLMTQSRSLIDQIYSTSSTGWMLCTAGAAAAVALTVRRWLPQWPAAALGLTCGLLVAAAASLNGAHLPSVSLEASSLRLPLMLADFSALADDAVDIGRLFSQISVGAAVLAMIVFINTTMTSKMLSQVDDRAETSVRSGLMISGGFALAGLLGSAPLSGSIQSCQAASRHSPMHLRVLLASAAVIAAIAATGILAWIPLVSVAAVLLVEAWFMPDRNSLQMLLRWLRREKLGRQMREDLALVVMVTASGLLINMVVAVVVGLLVGLVLFAARHAALPVRQVLSGSTISSNCARSRRDLATLAQEGERIRVFELGEDLFFGAADALDRTIRPDLGLALVAVFDWSHVRHVDSSMLLELTKLERRAHSQGVTCLHGGPATGSTLHELVASGGLVGTMYPDLDRALEAAENVVLNLSDATSHGSSTQLDSAMLFSGLSDLQRNRLDKVMTQRMVPAGEAVFRAGDPSEALVVVLHGAASIVMHMPSGQDVRLAGVRRGATLGEIGFLDGAPRSASVIASEPMLLGVLSRQDFNALALEDPPLVAALLTNIALDVAARLRHTNRLAIERQRRR